MPFKHLKLLLAALAAFALMLTGCVGAPDAKTSKAPSGEASAASQSASAKDSDKTSTEYPLTVNNCGFEITYDKAPTKAVTLNQGATEVMLALGLEKFMVGTAYIDDEISEKWKSAYDSVKVLSEKYPDKETFLATKPDFAYASFNSAFKDKAVGTREELKEENISSYLSIFYCEDKSLRPEPNVDNSWLETKEIAKIFNVSDRAEKLIADQKATIEKIKTNQNGKDRTALWYDSDDKTPFVGTGTGTPQAIMDMVGLKNIFGDIKEGSGWGDGSWEKVVEADPDVIVLAEASWSTSAEKIKYMENDPVLKNLKAVKNKNYVIVPFSETVSGIRLVDGAERVNKALADIK